MLLNSNIEKRPFQELRRLYLGNNHFWNVVVSIIIVQYAIFKVLYPFPNFMQPDSDNYIEAALKNDVINVWPIGYSKFILLIRTVTRSHFVLTAIQYVGLQFSIVYF